MRRSLLGRVFAALFLLVFVGLVVTLALAWSTLPLDRATISIDGQSVALSNLDGWHAALAIFATAAAVLVALVIAALAVVFALGVAVLAVTIALLTVAACVALVASPLLLLVWLVWRAVRPAPRAAVVAA